MSTGLPKQRWSSAAAAPSEPSPSTLKAVHGAGRSESNLHPELADSFAELFQVLQHFAADGELLIASCSTLSHRCRIEFASRAFAGLLSHDLHITKGPFAEALANSARVHITDAQALSQSEIGLSDLAKHPGPAAIFCVRLSAEHMALILYTQPIELGELSSDRLQAMQNLCKLTSLAAKSEDLAVEIEGSQLLLDSLRSEVRDGQAFFKLFTDSLGKCFWITNIDSGQTQTISENFLSIWGSDPKVLNEGLTGFMTSVLPIDRDRALADFHLKLGSQMETEFRVISTEGEIRWMNLCAYPIHQMKLAGLAPGPGPTDSRRILLVATDITEKKMSEESSRDREVELIARARMMAVGELASGVAHEVNNPLAIVIGKISEVKRLLREPNVDPKLLLEINEKVHKATMRISGIVSSLNSLAHDDQKLICESVEFSKVIHDVRDMCQEKFKVNEVKFDIDSGFAGQRADMNSAMMTQLLLHLVDNALFAAKSEKEKWVRLETMENQDSYFVSVTDSGSGIPVKYRSRIFDPFFTTKGPGVGTGLGLSVALNIATRHGGTLCLDALSPHTRLVLQLPKKHS